jgi:hypothetical protein
MPKSGRPTITDPVRSYSFGLRASQAHYIESVGIGENLGEKLRSVLDRCVELLGQIAHTPGAVLLFYAKEGERVWIDNPPFELPQKNWKLVPAIARENGWLCQIIENEETGDIEVWVAPGKVLMDCAACRKRVMEVMHE